MIAIITALLSTNLVFTTSTQNNLQMTSNNVPIIQHNNALEKEVQTQNKIEIEEEPIAKTQKPDTKYIEPVDVQNSGIVHNTFPFAPYSHSGYISTFVHYKEFIFNHMRENLGKYCNQLSICLRRLKYIGYAYVETLANLDFLNVNKGIQILSEPNGSIDIPKTLETKFIRLMKNTSFASLLEPHAFVTMLIFQKYNHGWTFWSDVLASPNEIAFFNQNPNTTGQAISDEFEDVHRAPTGVHYFDKELVGIGIDQVLSSFQNEIKIYEDILFPSINAICNELSKLIDDWEIIGSQNQMLYLTLAISIEKLYKINIQNVTGEIINKFRLEHFDKRWLKFPDKQLIVPLKSINQDFDTYLPHISFLLHFCGRYYAEEFELICHDDYNWSVRMTETYKRSLYGLFDAIFISDKVVSFESIANSVESYTTFFLSTPVISEYASYVLSSGSDVNQACSIYKQKFTNVYRIPINKTNEEEQFSGWDISRNLREIFSNVETRYKYISKSTEATSEAGFESCMVMVFYTGVASLINSNDSPENRVCYKRKIEFNIENFIKKYSGENRLQSVYGEINQEVWAKTIEFVDMRDVCTSPQKFILSLYINLPYGRRRFVEL